MALVRSVSNHPYGGSMRLVGAVYETTSDEDAKLLESLKRAVRLTDRERQALQKDTKEGQTYETRELQARQAGEPGIMTTAGVQRPAAAPSAPAVAPTQRTQQSRRTTSAPQRLSGATEPKSDSET